MEGSVLKSQLHKSLENAQPYQSLTSKQTDTIRSSQGQHFQPQKRHVWPKEGKSRKCPAVTSPAGKMTNVPSCVLFYVSGDFGAMHTTWILSSLSLFGDYFPSIVRNNYLQRDEEQEIYGTEVTWIAIEQLWSSKVWSQCWGNYFGMVFAVENFSKEQKE